jgi:ribokinase
MYDVITMGSATVDLFAVISKRLTEPKPGDKVLIEKVDFEIGGGGVNSAVAFSRMGLKTAFLGKVSHDYNGVNVILELKKEKVEFIHLKPSNLPTSLSFILMSKKQKDRILYTYKGASDDLNPKEIDLSKLKKTKWLYMATLLGEAFKTAKKTAIFAKKNNIPLMFNPSSYLAAKGKEALSIILKSAAILVLNKSEAKLVLRTKTNDIKDLLKQLKKTGPNIVIITDGPRGVHAFDGNKIYYQPAYKVNVVSVTGAGDAFASGFLAGTIKGDDIRTSLKLGAANAASVIKYYGTKNKLLSYNQAKTFIKKQKA